MAIVSHSAVTLEPGLRRPRGAARIAALVFPPLLFAILASPCARADIYKWTDEQGRIVVSDILPTDPGKVTDMKLLFSTPQRSAASASAEVEAQAQEKRELEARVRELERKLEEQRSAPPAPNPVRAGGNAADYPAAPAPPPPARYLAEQPVDGTLYFPDTYTPPVVYTVITVPIRQGKHHHPNSHTGHAFDPKPWNTKRPVTAPGPTFTGPQFVGRPPNFVGRPPTFVTRSPAFLNSQSATTELPGMGHSQAVRQGGRFGHRAF